jgi:hypothetical protein
MPSCAKRGVAITDGEPDGIANMANVAALLAEFLPDLNWAGFTAWWKANWCSAVHRQARLHPHSARPWRLRRGGAPGPRSGWKTSTPFPAISPAMRPAGPNWSCR